MTVFPMLIWMFNGICTSLPAQQTGQKQDMYYTVKVSHKQVRRTVWNGFTRRTKQSSSLQVLVWLSRGQLVRTSLCKSGKSVGRLSHLRNVLSEAVNLQRGMI